MSERSPRHLSIHSSLYLRTLTFTSLHTGRSNAEATKALFAKYKPTHVIHLAALGA